MNATQSDNPARRQYFRRFLAYALNYKLLLVVAAAMGVAKFGITYVLPWLTKLTVDNVVAPTVPLSQEQRLGWLWTVIGIGLGATVIHSIASYGRGYYSAKIGNRVIADLRQDLFDHLHRLSLHFYSRERTGSIISRLIADIQQASQLINGGVIAVVMDMSSMVVGLVILFSLDWQLTVACLVIMPLYGLTFRVLNPKVKHASARVQSQLSKITGNVQERLAGIALIKSYAAEGRERRTFHADTEEHYDRVLEQSSLAQLVGGISEGLVDLGKVIVLGVGGYFAVAGGRLSAGELMQFMGSLAVMYLPVRRFAQVNIVYQTSLAAIERVFQVLDITPKIVEQPEAVRVSPQRGEVIFQNVWFNYSDDSDESRISLEEAPPNLSQLLALKKHPPRGGRRGTAAGAESEASDRSRISDVRSANAAVESTRSTLPNGQGRAQSPQWILQDLSFTVAAGERIALVGPSGSGKTTLVSLLPRLYDITEGRIVIDGVDVRDYRLRALRRAIGIVQQDSFLFSGTVGDNIAYGRPDAADEQIIEAARAANAHPFIMDLPDGYHTQLGERGVNLSGGQRQRISIARAILKDPRILILDEATSALDTESEALVQEALGRLMVGRTCFIIAHRLSTVRHVDRILVLQHGRLVEIGTHEQLLDHGGLYARLVNQQFGLEASERHLGQDAEQSAPPAAV